jgi:hypothetical protein
MVLLSHLTALIIALLDVGICQENDESTDGKILYRPTLGRPAAIGMLYSAHSDNFIPGFGFWEESELDENKKVVCHASADTSFAYDETRSEKHNFLDVTAHIDISYEAGFTVHVWGSFAYLKHSEESENKASVRLSYKSITKTESISTYLTNKAFDGNHTSQACKWDKNGDIPTHVVSSVTYGGDAHFIFEKEFKNSDDKLEMHGEIEIEVQVKLLSIKGGASIDIDKNDEHHMNFTKISTYSDFILEEQPTSISDAIKLFKEQSI